MIVTCPSCSSKYRVRDEAVPRGGAQLQCPTCQAVFVAHPPKHSEAELRDAIERLTSTRDELEARAASADAQAAAHEARAREFETQLQAVRAELTAARDDATKRLRGREEEIARLGDEAQRLKEQVRRVGDTEARVAKILEEASQLRAAAARAAEEAARAKDELAQARATSARLHDDVLAAQKVIDALHVEIEQLKAANYAASQGRGPQASDLEAEVRRLRDQLAAAALAPSPVPLDGKGTVGHLQGLIAAVGPMLWGLEQAIKYLEPFSSNEPALAGHVRQLQLLCGVLTRLHRESASA